METRPFVYIGFGLRDADFWQIQDVILNTYEKGLNGHFAIMPDVAEYEIRAFKDKYNIDLFSYKTDRTRGKEAHAPLLDLLDQLKVSSADKRKKTSGIIDELFILNLARYASRYSGFEKLAIHIPLVSHQVSKRNNYTFYENGSGIEQLLDQEIRQIILTGLPGSGKSYSINQCISRLAAEINKQCLTEPFQPELVTIPILADLKLYQGDLWRLLEESLPVGIDLNFLLKHFRVKFFLDAFNEIPKEYIESGIWQTDFANVLTKIGSNYLVISSRTEHGLENLEFPVFNIDHIDKAFVDQKLKECNIEFRHAFEEDMYQILQRPFFYKLVFCSHFTIDRDFTPHGIYSTLLDSVNTSFQERFTTTIDLADLLYQTAKEAMDAGEEAFSTTLLINNLTKELALSDNHLFSAPDVIDWLVAREFLIALPGERICFFHQSVTEYLAARRLATIVESYDLSILKEKLTYRRWDHTLLLVLNFLNKRKANQFLKVIMEIDFRLAVSAVKYLETEHKDRITDKFLTEAVNREHFDDWLVEELQVGKAHIPFLKNLISRIDETGCVAFSCLVDLEGESFKKEGFQIVMKSLHNHEYCVTVAESLSKLYTKDDIKKLLQLTKRYQRKLKLVCTEYDDYWDFITGQNHTFVMVIGILIKHIDADTIRARFFDPGLTIHDQRINIEVVHVFLYGNIIDTSNKLPFALDLLMAGDDKIIHWLSLCFNNRISQIRPVDYSIINRKHLEELFTQIEYHDFVIAMLVVRDIVRERKDFIPLIYDRAAQKRGILKLVYIYCAVIHTSSHSPFFSLLKEITSQEHETLLDEPLIFLHNMFSLNWQGQESYFVELVKYGYKHLVYHLAHAIDFKHNSGTLSFDIGPVDWWLDKHSKLTTKDDIELYQRVPYIIMPRIPEDKKREFIDEFNKKDSPYRDTLIRFFLPEINITMDALNEDAVNYLLRQQDEHLFKYQADVLMNISDEYFVTDTLLPVWRSAKGKYKEQMDRLLGSLEGKFGRRYFLD